MHLAYAFFIKFIKFTYSTYLERRHVVDDHAIAMTNKCKDRIRAV